MNGNTYLFAFRHPLMQYPPTQRGRSGLWHSPHRALYVVLVSELVEDPRVRRERRAHRNLSNSGVVSLFLTHRPRGQNVAVNHRRSRQHILPHRHQRMTILNLKKGMKRPLSHCYLTLDSSWLVEGCNCEVQSAELKIKIIISHYKKPHYIIIKNLNLLYSFIQFFINLLHDIRP